MTGKIVLDKNYPQKITFKNPSNIRCKTALTRKISATSQNININMAGCVADTENKVFRT